MNRVRSKKTILTYNAMIIPGVIFLILFNIVPFIMGFPISFTNYVPAKGILGSKWVGFYWFRYMFMIPDATRVFANTLIIALGKIVMGLVVPIVFSLLLNEVRCSWYKRLTQTLVYLPHFLSWVILSDVFTSMLAVDGIINNVIAALGGERIFFLARADLFRPILIITETWKEFGFGTVVYLAAITSIDPSLYDSSALDGASRLQDMLYITLPSIRPTIVLMAVLSLGGILNGGFDQVFNMYSPLVYSTGDIIDTYVYRVGMVNMQYSLSSAVGMFKSVISIVLMTTTNYLANRFAGYRIF